MADFLFIYRGGNKTESEMSMEEMQEYMGKWFAWIGEGMEAGWITNPGDALQPEGRVVDADHVITDGPFAESKEIIGGYSVIAADNIDAAAELAKGCPGLTTGGKVEIRPLAKVEIENPQSS